MLISQIKRLRLVIGKDVIWSYLGEALSKGIYFIISVYLARMLGATGFGLFVFTQTIISYFWLAADAGISMYGSREISRNRDRANEVFNALLTLRVVAGFCVFLALIIGVTISMEPGISRTVFFFSSFFMLTRAVGVDWALKGLGQFKYVALGNLATFSLMFGLVLIYVDEAKDVTSAALIWAISYLFGSGMFLYIVASKFKYIFVPILSPNVLVSHLKQSMHFTASGSLMLLYQCLPIILLGYFVSADEVGLFSAPYKLTMLLVYGASVLPLTIFPTLSEKFQSDRRQFQKLRRELAKVMLIIGLGITLFCLFFSKEIVIAVYGDEYADAVMIFRVMLCYFLLCCIRFPFGISVSAAGMQKLYTGVGFVAVCCYLLFFGLIGETGGAVAAATLALPLTELVVVALLVTIWGRSSERLK